jgi:hypothetical protein
MRITEYMYTGNNGEFAEFTNVGSTAIDMTGWSYDDNGATPGTVSLSTYGIVQPGASVILTETITDTFRKDWSLCNGVGIIGGNTTNLGRNDQINLYNNKGVLIDRLTYGDQDFPGTIRTQDVSGYVSAAALGIDSIAGWTLSSVGDAEGSYTSSGGDIGSPGKSTRKTVAYDPCYVNPNAPVIAMDVVNTSNYIDQGDSVSPVSPYALSGVIGDPLDPVATQGIYFTISDPNIPASQLTVTVSSSDTTVVPTANLILTGGAASRNLLIVPAGVGYSSITVTVNDGTFTSSYVIDYAASVPAFTSASSSVTWPTGSSDASAAYGIDNNYMVIGDDQQNRLLVYNRTHSGLPATTFDYTVNNNLQLTDGYCRKLQTAGHRGGRHQPVTPGLTYWMGSESNSSTSPYPVAPNRDRLFAINISGTGATTAFTFGGYVQLRTQLINWGDKYGYDFTDAAAAGQNPKAINGYNIEGIGVRSRQHYAVHRLPRAAGAHSKPHYGCDRACPQFRKLVQWRGARRYRNARNAHRAQPRGPRHPRHDTLVEWSVRHRRRQLRRHQQPRDLSLVGECNGHGRTGAILRRHGTRSGSPDTGQPGRPAGPRPIAGHLR